MVETVPAAATGDDSKPRRRWTIRFRRKPETPVDWKRLFFLLLGIFLFLAVYLSPPWPDAVDPMGETFELSHQGKAALGLFLLAAVWWVFEVIPIGVTSITIAVIQVLFLIRPDIMLVGGHAPIGGPELAFKEFMHPSVWFIFGSIVIGMVFTKTGLTKRLAYKMLVGGRENEPHLPRLLRHDRHSDPRHGPHRGRGNGLSAAGRHLSAL